MQGSPIRRALQLGHWKPPELAAGPWALSRRWWQNDQGAEPPLEPASLDWTAGRRGPFVKQALLCGVTTFGVYGSATQPSLTNTLPYKFSEYN